jgi:hypothetical protein
LARIIAALLTKIFVELQKLNVASERFSDVERFRQARLQRVRLHLLQELRISQIAHFVGPSAGGGL